MSSPPPPKIWSFDDPFRDPKSTEELIEEASKQDMSSWKIVLEERLSVHKDRCERWKAEIENLLVFAGLFSAVVTTFVVDSYKNIKPNPQDTAVVLLAQLVSQLAPGHNNSISTAPIPPSTPDQSQVRVNTLWFLSLVLALGTAVGGITVLQWIRSFQQYDRNLTYKQSFALASLRDRSVKNWKVAGFIATLPFLLQLALVLFLIGLSDFLWNTVSHTIAIPCMAASAVIITFLVTSIVLPTGQYFILRIGGFGKKIPTPCPYRSPPGWAFLRFTLWIGTISGLRRVIHRLFGSKIGDKKGQRQSSRMERFVSFEPHSQGDRDGTEEAASTLEWIRADLNWLLARSRSHAPPRSQDANEQNPSSKPDDSDNDYDGAYDAAIGFSSMQDYTFQHLATPYVLYNCFRDLPPHLVKNTTLWSGAVHDADGGLAVKVETLYDDSHGFGGTLKTLSKAEDDMVFLEWLERTKKMQLGPGIAERQLEICVRLLATIFHRSPTSPSPQLKPSDEDRVNLMWLPSALLDRQTDRLSFFQSGGTIKEQILLIFERMVTSSKSNQPLAPIGLYHARGQVDGFVFVTALIIAKLVAHSDSYPLSDSTSIETTGTRINESIKHFLMENLRPNQHNYLQAPSTGGPMETPHHCFPALYFLSFLYLRQLIYEFDTRRLPPNELRFRAPKFGQSFVDLANTWIDVTEEIGIPRLDNMKFWLFTSFSGHVSDLERWLRKAREGKGRETTPGPDSAGGSTGPTYIIRNLEEPVFRATAVRISGNQRFDPSEEDWDSRTDIISSGIFCQTREYKIERPKGLVTLTEDPSDAV